MNRLEQLLQMLEEDPSDMFLNYALGMEYITLDPEKAILQFEKVLKLKEDYVPAYYQMGQLYMTLNNNKTALMYLQKGRAMARIQNNLKAAGEFEEAIFLAED